MRHSMRQGVVLTGDWRKLNAYMRAMEYTSEEVNELIEQEAHDMADAIRGAMLAYTDIPNAEATVRRKGFNNPFYDTGELIHGDGIVVERIVETYKKHYFLIQGNDSLQTRDTDDAYTYKEVLGVLEWGTANIPPRPVFTLTFDERSGGIASRIIARVASLYGRGRW
jgi:hypothetical protein